MRRSFVAATAATALIFSAAPTPALSAPTPALAAPALGNRRVVATAARPAPGGSGVGDPYFADYGNSGYDVTHYDIRLRYHPKTDRLSGTTTILATSTAELSSFNLDFLLNVSSVRVNGRIAAATRQGDHELVVTPAVPLAADQPFTVVVRYAGVPSTKVAGGVSAWTRTADGALAVGQPEIAWWWFPSNDHPSDKATFDISVLAPDGVEVLSNGVLAGAPVAQVKGWSRWNWRSAKPMATYLAFLAIGQYDIVTDVTASGTPVINAYSKLLPRDIADAARSSVQRTSEVVAWASKVFGPYPFEAQGGVVVPPEALGFALENQTRPVYSGAFFWRGANMSVVAHELAHQWAGDSVAVAQWDDIWLNEGFASYAEWLFSEQQGEGTAQELFDYAYASYPRDDPFWTVKIADPGPDRIFDSAVYDRGAMTLHHLRRTIGDDAFFALLRAWMTKRRHSNGDTAGFIALAEQMSGRQLDKLFQAWLYTPRRPAVAGAPAAVRANTPPPKPRSWDAIRLTRELHRH